jgi:hypothetical protein
MLHRGFWIDLHFNPDMAATCSYETSAGTNFLAGLLLGLHVHIRSDNNVFFLRFQVFSAVILKNVFCDIKTQVVLHRRHITSLLQSPAS